jgi:ATP-binding cassette subfamily B protein
VLYAGLDIRSINLRLTRKQIGVVPQSSHMIPGTIMSNICVGISDVSRDVVEQASKLACIHDEIERMPMGYWTVVGESGCALSGGERQRIALARALVREPKLLLIDEGTSALDGITEAKVQQNLAKLRCTRIVIAHRLSTVRDADRILVMDAGRVVESGDHAGLMRAGGFYARLNSSQAERRVPSKPGFDSLGDHPANRRGEGL